MSKRRKKQLNEGWLILKYGYIIIYLSEWRQTWPNKLDQHPIEDTCRQFWLVTAYKPPIRLFLLPLYPRGEFLSFSELETQQEVKGELHEENVYHIFASSVPQGRFSFTSCCVSRSWDIHEENINAILALCRGNLHKEMVNCILKAQFVPNPAWKALD